MANPFKAFVNIRKQELPLALLMFGYFFLVISTFWILKPLKKPLLVDYYKATPLDLFGWKLDGAGAEQIAKLLNMVVAFCAVMVFVKLARSLRREQLTYVFSAFSAVCLVIYALLGNEPSELVIWSFYLFGDLFNSLMVATFFAFLADSISPEAAKRLYGVIVLGGVSGGVFGSTSVAAFISKLSFVQWMWICVSATALLTLCAWQAGRVVRQQKTDDDEEEQPAEKKQNAAIEGLRLVGRSRYLLAIVAMVGLYELVSTVLDFQFTATVTHYFDKTGPHVALVYAITNWFSLGVQLFLTTFIMSRAGLKWALLIMPAAILLSSGAFLVLPILWVGSSLSTSDNGFNYSLNQSAREALWTVTTRDEKYKAKALIDMFVQRSAKALGVGINLLMIAIFALPGGGSSFGGVRWLSLVTIAATAAWVFAARYAGGRFDAQAAK